MNTFKKAFNTLEDNLLYEVTTTLNAYQKANRLASARRNPSSAIHRMDIYYEAWRAHNLKAGRTVAGDVPFFIRITILNSIARSDFFKTV